MIAPQAAERFRAALEQRRDSVQAELDQLDRELRLLGGDQGDENGALGNHLADDGSYVQESDRILRLTSDLEGIQNEIEDAFGRLDNGTYGICQRCGKPIPQERLEYLPFVAYDVECQAIIEREGGSR